MGRRRHLVVLEGRWYDQRNLSLKGVFDVLSDVLYDTPHGYYHEHFCDATALAAIARRVARWDDTYLLYIGAHGDEDGVFGSLDGVDGYVKRAQLRKALRDLEGSYHGLFVASCGFLTARNAAFLLETSFWGKRPGVRWVAGYSTPVDFLDATALELFFLNRLLADYSPKEWVASLAAAANATRDAMPGLVRGLGFRVYRRIQGSDQIDPVLEPDDWDDEP